MPDQPIDILLVEDSVDDSAFVVNALEEGRFDVRLTIVRDGAEAFTAIFGVGNSPDGVPLRKPKLIILDLKLPKVSGIEVLRRLKSNLHTRSIPIVVLSSSQQKCDLDESYQLGVNSCLVKPMDIDDFTTTVQMLCRYWVHFNQPNF